MHQVWDKLLDDDFLHAYEHGFVAECLDNVWRRFYPRLFTYSADYPEKYVWYCTSPSTQLIMAGNTEFSSLPCATRETVPAHDVLC